VELSREPYAFSALIGRPVEDQSGRSLGRLYEVRARWEGRQVVFEELLVGRRGLLRRLRGPSPGSEGIAWEAVVDLGPDRIVVRG
jgi:hypothetical protein